MKYEIAYVSLSGNTEKLAHGIADKFPVSETILTDLSCEELSLTADIYLLGFGVNKGTVPLKIMEALDELHNKTIMFFVTAGMEPELSYRDSVENKITPFLPDDCNYLGMFMCQGKFPDEVLRAARLKLEEEPDNKYAKRIILDDELSNVHPNEKDFENAYNFIIGKIK